MLIDNPGETIKALRTRLGLTLSQVSADTGLSISSLSKMERGRTSLSWQKLSILSACLGADMAELLGASASDAQKPPAWGCRRTVQRAGEGRPVDAGSDGQRFLATELLSKRMTPILAQPQARTIEEFKAEFGDLVRRRGEEFALVLQGEVEFHCEIYAPLRLKVGDTIYFDTEMGHAYLKVGAQPCVVMTVCSLRDAGKEMKPSGITAFHQRDSRAWKISRA
jgi:transcriptional regulator with XRE-family HTH domain